jgi:hypothetical protein
MTPYRIQESDLLIPSEWSDQSLTLTFNVSKVIEACKRFDQGYKPRPA